MTRIETYYRLLKHDSKGQLVKDTGLIPSHSYVLQFLTYLEGLMCRIDKSGKDVNGASERIVKDGTSFNKFGQINAALGDDTHGIVVGTNATTTAEDNENYKLDTKILHSGIGDAGKLNYQVVTFIAPRVVGVNVDYDINRAFLNETGNTITVKEIGIICKNSDATKYHLLLRDVVSDEAVLDGYTLTVVYTLRTTV